jgi:hypothetical protein
MTNKTITTKKTPIIVMPNFLSEFVFISFIYLINLG